MAKRCPNCGKTVADNAKFCIGCGTRFEDNAERRCPQCGSPVAGDSTFCMHCGYRLPAVSPVHKTVKKTCPSCGRPVKEDAQFCMNCGHALNGSSSVTNAAEIKKPADSFEKRSPAGKTAAALSANKPDISAEKSSSASAKEQQSAGLMAPAAIGEINLDDFSVTSSGDMNSMQNSTSPDVKDREIPSPAAGIFQSIGSFLAGIFTMFRNPQALFSAILMAVIWSVLAYLKDSDSEIVKILSWLTFAEGGMGSSAERIIGGILGKGSVAVCLTSVFRGGIGNTFKGLFELLKRKGEKRSLPAFLTGMFAGMAAGFAFVGFDSGSFSTSMAGISSSLLCLQAAGKKDGLLYRLVTSLTSEKNNDARIQNTGRIKSMLSGGTAGFALSALLTSIGM